MRIAAALAWMLVTLGVASASDLPVKAAPKNAPSPFVEVFGGFAADRASYYGDLGATFAVNRKIFTNGWLVRFNGGAGQYRYMRTATQEQRVTFGTGDVMAGYQWYLPHGARFTAYAGGYFEHHDNSDVSATIRGTRAGVKGQVEYYAPIHDRAFAYVMANGTSVWGGYFAIGKLGYRLSRTVAVGPEVTALGNDRFGAARVGPWISFDIGGADIILSGGYSWDTKDDNPFRNNDGAYGTLHARRVF